MEERALKNGCFFVNFVMFNSTLVFSVIWNLSALIPDCKVVTYMQL